MWFDCTSGRTWTGGNEGSPEMNPGMACIQCHAANDEGPRFSIAGTVYRRCGAGRCNGAARERAQVVITGADGRATLSFNGASSFFSESVTEPYRAKVVTAAGGEWAMTAAQTSGDCNSCSHAVGANGAPGRISA